MNSPTITPTAVDAYVFIESIRIVDRHRKELGDLQGLMKSIEDIGLLHPPTITEDSRLVAGQRRIEACRQLGWDSVPVRIAKNLDEAARLLRAERDENVERKEMLPSEKASLGAALEGIEAEAARERQGTRTDLGRELPTLQGGKSTRSGQVAAIVGDTLGMSRSTYTELRFAHQAANDPARGVEVQALAATALREIDEGSGVQPTVAKLRSRLRAREDVADIKAAVMAEPKTEPKSDSGAKDDMDPAWVPSGRDSSPNAVKQRRKLIAHHAGRGLSSRQIAELVSIEDTRVRKVARDAGIQIPADAVVGRQRRIDSNRVVRETVYALDGVAMSVQLVHVDELDRDELAAWTESLTSSTRVLNRFLKQLKELAS